MKTQLRSQSGKMCTQRTFFYNEHQRSQCVIVDLLSSLLQHTAEYLFHHRITKGAFPGASGGAKAEFHVPGRRWQTKVAGRSEQFRVFAPRSRRESELINIGR